MRVGMGQGCLWGTLQQMSGKPKGELTFSAALGTRD